MKILIVVVSLFVLQAGYASGVDLDRCSMTGENPIWSIVRNNDQHITASALAAGNADFPDDVLSTAVTFDFRRLLDKLLRDRHLVEVHGGDALTAAAAMGRIGITRLLLESGISPNAKNNLGNTAVWAAAQYGCTDEMEFLIKHGAHINFDVKPGHNTPMINAIYGHHYQTAAVLLKSGYRVKPWEIEKIKAMLKRQRGSSVWSYLFAPLVNESSTDPKRAHSSINWR